MGKIGSNDENTVPLLIDLLNELEFLALALSTYLGNRDEVYVRLSRIRTFGDWRLSLGGPCQSYHDMAPTKYTAYSSRSNRISIEQARTFRTELAQLVISPTT